MAQLISSNLNRTYMASLLAHSFIQSKVDSCLYLRKDCIIVIYTNDCLIFTKDDSTIDQLIASSESYLLKTKDA